MQGPETPAGTRNATAPADAAFRVDAIKVADQKHAERAARRDRPAVEFFGVERSALLFEECVKFFLMQKLLQPPVKEALRRIKWI